MAQSAGEIGIRHVSPAGNASKDFQRSGITTLIELLQCERFNLDRPAISTQRPPFAREAAFIIVLTRWNVDELGPIASLPFIHKVGFVTVIGASAHVGTVLKVGPVLFVFAALILTVHLAFLLLAWRLLRVDLAEALVASNANMGGPTTAAAMAVARRWPALVTPAILVGTLVYGRVRPHMADLL